MKTTTNISINSQKARTAELTRALSLLLLLIGFGVMSAGAQVERLHTKTTQQAETDKVTIPKTLPAVWGEIIKHHKALYEVLESNALDRVHLEAFAIRDYVAALPRKSKLSGDKSNLLKSYVAHVDSLAEQLDEAGDAGDSAKVATLASSLDADLKSIENLYPAKDLKFSQGATAMEQKTYVCPMHPEVTSDKLGTCPKCGMDLVLKETAKKDSLQQHH